MASVKERSRTETILPRLGVGKETDRGQEAACDQYFEEKRDHHECLLESGPAKVQLDNANPVLSVKLPKCVR